MLKLSKGDEGENLIKPEIFNCYTAGNSTIAVVIQCNNNELVTTCATGSIPKKELQPLASSPNIDEWLQQLQHKKSTVNLARLKKRKGASERTAHFRRRDRRFPSPYPAV